MYSTLYRHLKSLDVQHTIQAMSHSELPEDTAVLHSVSTKFCVGSLAYVMSTEQYYAFRTK